MAVLVKVNGNPPGQLIELTDEETSIGRLPECSVTLDLQGVSRKHAIIRRSGKDFFLVDLRSRNKTFLNEREVPPEQDQLLQQGDRILICDVEMVFYQAMPAEPQPEPKDQVVVTDGVEDSTICTLDASRSDLVTCAVRPEAKLKAILDITRNLCSSLELDTVAPKILDSLLEIFPQAERVFLVLLKQGEPKHTIRQTYHKNRPYKRTGSKAPLGRPGGDESRLSISRTIMNAVLNQKKAVLSQDAGNDQNLPTSASIADLRIRSFMCAPLLTPDNQALGILQIDTTDRKQFAQEDLDVLLAVASQAAIAVQNADMHESILVRERLDRDMRLAEQVQRRFLPQGVPKIDGYEFHAYYQSFYEVGGDYYDFVPLPGNRLALALGDVSGKGIAAALMMAKFSGDTRYCILTQDAPGRAADQLNVLVNEAGFDERFITLCLGVLDLSDRNFTFSSAGHLPILVRRRNGRVEAFGQDVSGLPLGIMPNSCYGQVGTVLEPGDVAVVYSDGVTDARNPKGELYDTSDSPRLSRRIAATPGSAETVGKAIIQDIREFSAGQYQTDDITLICFGPVSS
jgi:serine phosphatase RsbU (regulator of sigma subunit)/pSer/pThr/pTyr-binding forkhead associated (FHA) protein